MQPSVPPPPGVRRPLSVTMKPGWAFDAKARRFRGPRGATCTPSGLPRGTRIAPTVPQLAGRAATSLSAAERALQAYVQVVLPRGHQPEDYVAAIREWPCAQSVAAGPSVSLPTGAPRTLTSAPRKTAS